MAAVDDACRIAGRSRCTGFTLVELIVSVTMLGLIIGPFTRGRHVLHVARADTTGVFADDTSIRSVISLFTTDAQSAETVTAPDPVAVRVGRAARSRP